MTLRRPLVRNGGRTEQLPAGEAIAGVPVAVPAFTAAGTILRVVLTIDYSLPVLTAGGATLNVPAVLNG